MIFNLEMIQIIGPALVAGLMICIIHGTLGIKVLNRGIIFIDLSIAQIAGLGLVICGVLLGEISSYISQLVALICAISASIFFYYIEKKAPKQQEAIIGCSFVLSASIAILLLADNPHGGDEIMHLLSGQMLFITWNDVLKHFPIYAFIISIWFLKPKIQNGIGFYLIFALAITSSVQLVGVYVVFASLILPALAAVNQKRPLLVSWVCGILSIFSGIFFATIFDLPAGGTVVTSYALVASGFFIYSLFKNLIFNK
jgi:zinc/manganese transport system permease protein